MRPLRLASLRSTPAPGSLLVLLLSLSACRPHLGPEDADTLFRARWGDKWREHDEARETTLDGRTLVACAVSDPSKGIADDETTLCLHLRLAESHLGTGPATLAIEGAVQVPPQGDPTFTPASAHSPGVEAAWAWTGCFAPAQPAPVTQQVRGQLELTENSATRLAGRVGLSAEGTLAGRCAGEAAEFLLDFALAR